MMRYRILKNRIVPILERWLLSLAQCPDVYPTNLLHRVVAHVTKTDKGTMYETYYLYSIDAFSDAVNDSYPTDWIDTHSRDDVIIIVQKIVRDVKKHKDLLYYET